MIDVRLLKNCVLFRFKTKCAWGNSGKGDLSEEAILNLIGPGPLGELASERAARVEWAKPRLRLAKKLIECEEYTAVKRFQAEVKGWLLRGFCNPSFIDDGLYSLRTDLVATVATEVKNAQKGLQALVSKFLEVYPSKIKEAEALGIQFDERNYPPVEKLERAFSMEYKIVQLDIPEGLPPEIRAEEEKKLKASFAAAEQELTLALRSGFANILEHITDRLQPQQDGTRKKFNDTLFVDFAEFIGSFGNKNVLGDNELSALVEQAKGIWQNVANGSGQDLGKAAKRVRDIQPVREKALAAFSEVKAALDKTIADMPKRSFDFSEE